MSSALLDMTLGYCEHMFITQHQDLNGIIASKRYADDVILPEYATSGAAGMDIAAHIDTAVILTPFARAAIATGFSMHSPMTTCTPLAPSPQL